MYPSISQNDLKTIFLKLYEVLIEEYDAVDNGINPTSESPKFITGTSSIFSQISRLNYINGNTPIDSTQANAQFNKAMELCKNLFLDVLQDLMFNWLPARSIVIESISMREGPIVILKTPCAWKDHLFHIEKDIFDGNSPLLYVLYEKELDGMWMAQAISTCPASFECRLAFPEAWRGLRDKELESVTKIPGTIFVHASGFLAGSRSRSVALELVNASISLQSKY